MTGPAKVSGEGFWFAVLPSALFAELVEKHRECLLLVDHAGERPVEVGGSSPRAAPACPSGHGAAATATRLEDSSESGEVGGTLAVVGEAIWDSNDDIVIAVDYRSENLGFRLPMRLSTQNGANTKICARPTLVFFVFVRVGGGDIPICNGDPKAPLI